MKKQGKRDFIITKALLSLRIFLIPAILSARSIHRPVDNHMPCVQTMYTDGSASSSISSYHLMPGPLFYLFDPEHFQEHQLPQNEIPFRYKPQESVLGAVLKERAEDLLQEIYQGKKTFTHFDILKKSNFNKKKQIGLIILKYKEYPFVLKLFIEGPQTLLGPNSTGIEPTCFFYMGGGVCRHISGFTRIKNLNAIKKKVMSDPLYKNQIDFPRKWFWQPKKPTWIELYGKNFTDQELHASIPAVYGIIADQIIWEREFTLSDPLDRQTAMNFSNFLNQSIDPHINNFGIEKSSKKIVPIDFELFPLVVGIRIHKNCDGYVTWYTSLAKKMFLDTWGQTKQERKTRHELPLEPYIRALHRDGTSAPDVAAPG